LKFYFYLCFVYLLTMHFGLVAWLTKLALIEILLRFYK